MIGLMQALEMRQRSRVKAKRRSVRYRVAFNEAVLRQFFDSRVPPEPELPRNPYHSMRPSLRVWRLAIERAPHG